MIQRMLATGGLLLLSAAVMAQGSRVLSCYNYMQQGELDKALEAIEPATTHEKTGQKAKTWYYRGQVYQSIYESLNPTYKQLHAAPLPEAVDSYLKALTLDSKKIDVKELNRRLKIAGTQMLGEGVNLFNQQKLPDALKHFEYAAKVSKHYGKVDSMAIFNAGLVADRMQDYPKAITYYQQTADIGYGGAQGYLMLASVYQAQEAEDKYREAVRAGRAKFPSDQGLLTAEINIYLKEGKAEEARANIDQAIEGDPSNHTLYFARGTLHEQSNALELAEADYRKAVELDGQYFDAWYNLGALFFNMGVRMNDAANAIPTDDLKAFDAAKAEATAKFQASQPFLEKAEQLNPDDRGTLESLKQLYAYLKDTPNYERVSKKLGN